MSQRTTNHDSTVSCDTADFIRGTLAFTANLSNAEIADLNAHALHCERDDWYHALPTPLWGSVRRDRERAQ